MPHVHNLIGDNCNGFFKDQYVQKTFYGRKNRLYFKLCHDYCGSCIEYGITENEQKCLTCSEEYSFDYWFYLKKYIANCVPDGYFYDNETSTLVQCDSQAKKKYALNMFMNVHQNILI